MKLLISNAQVCDPASPFHGKICDIWINGNSIELVQLSSKKSSAESPGNYKSINAKGLMVFPGLFDMRADFCDPGFEFKESLTSGAATALKGGFTDIAILPSTDPVRDSKIGIEYVLNQSNNLPVNLHAYGCLSQHRDGKEMAELYDMQLAGACGFTDGNRPVANSGLLLRALLYNKIFNGLSLVLADDPNLSSGGKMHEGNVSTVLGLKGIPSLAEELMVQRDIELVKYTEGRLHFSAITTKGSVEMIRKAKRQGLKITADVAFANLCYTEENLIDYDSNYKLFPPLRSKHDQKALWEGIEDGTIDAICSNHQPQNKENKDVEFEYALPGMITLQTMLPVLIKNIPEKISIDKVISALTKGPRNILGLAQLSITNNSVASLTLFDPKFKWIYNDNKSRSENSPLLGKEIQGAIKMVVCKDKIYSF